MWIIATKALRILFLSVFRVFLSDLRYIGWRVIPATIQFSLKKIRYNAEYYLNKKNDRFEIEFTDFGYDHPSTLIALSLCTDEVIKIIEFGSDFEAMGFVFELFDSTYNFYFDNYVSAFIWHESGPDKSLEKILRSLANSNNWVIKNSPVRYDFLDSTANIE